MSPFSRNYTVMWYNSANQATASVLILGTISEQTIANRIEKDESCLILINCFDSLMFGDALELTLRCNSAYREVKIYRL